MSASVHRASLTVVIGSGSIAVSNLAGLVNLLRERVDGDIIAVLTSQATQFVSAETVRYAGGAAAVLIDSSSALADQPNHVWLAAEMSCLLVYPASANFIARIAAGLANDLASLVFLAGHDKPRMIVPSMNPMMWSNPLVDENISKLRHRGVRVANSPNGLAPDLYSIADEFCDFACVPRTERTDVAVATAVAADRGGPISE